MDKKVEMIMDEERFKDDYNRNEIEKRIKELCAAARETNMSMKAKACI